jgi:hypothetical protein
LPYLALQRPRLDHLNKVRNSVSALGRPVQDGSLHMGG